MRYGLGFVLTVNASNFRQGFRHAASDVRRFEGKYAQAFRRMEAQQRQLALTTTRFIGILSGLYVGVAAFAALTAQAKKYDFEVRGLAAVTKTTRSEMDRLVQTIYKSTASLREFSMVEVARASRQLSQAGYNMQVGSEGARVLQSSLNAVIASFGSLNPDAAIQLGINLEKGFGRGQRGIAELYDTVGEAVNLFPMQMDQIRTALGYATQSAQNYNQSLESTILALGTLMPIVATASKTGVAYRNSLAGLTKPFTMDFITKHSIAVRTATGEFRDAMEIMFDINDALDETRAKDMRTRGGETQTMLHQMFGIRGKALFTAIQQLPNLVSQMPGMGHVTKETAPREAYVALQMKLFAGAGGALDRLATAMSTSSEIIDRKFNASIENATQLFGEHFRPTVDAVKLALVGFMDRLTEGTGALGVMFSKVLPGIGTAVAALLPTLAAVATLFGIKAVGGVLGRIRTGWGLGGPAYEGIAGSAVLPGMRAASGGRLERFAAFSGMGGYYDRETAGGTPGAGPRSEKFLKSRKATGWFGWGDPTKKSRLHTLRSILGGLFSILGAIGIGWTLFQSVMGSIGADIRTMYKEGVEKARQEQSERDRQRKSPARIMKAYLSAFGMGKKPTDAGWAKLASRGDVGTLADLHKFRIDKKLDPLEGYKQYLDRYFKDEMTRGRIQKGSTEYKKEKMRFDKYKETFEDMFLEATPRSSQGKKIQRTVIEQLLYLLRPTTPGQRPPTVNYRSWMSQPGRDVQVAGGMYEGKALEGTPGKYLGKRPLWDMPVDRAENWKMLPWAQDWLTDISVMMRAARRLQAKQITLEQYNAKWFATITQVEYGGIPTGSIGHGALPLLFQGMEMFKEAMPDDEIRGAFKDLLMKTVGADWLGSYTPFQPADVVKFLKLDSVEDVTKLKPLVELLQSTGMLVPPPMFAPGETPAASPTALIEESKRTPLRVIVVNPTNPNGESTPRGALGGGVP